VRPRAGALPEVLVPLRQFARAVLVLDEQAGRSGHNADPGYRQIAQLSSYGPQPPSLVGLGRKDQFKIVSSSQREVNRITIPPAQPRFQLCRNRQSRGIQRDTDRRGLRNLTHTVCQSVAEIHAARRGAIASE